MKVGKELLFILLPFVIGWACIYVIPAPLLSQMIIVPFWLWVGRRFAQHKLWKIRSFALGNSVWGVCLGIFIWQFLFESAAHRIAAFETIAKTYISSFALFTEVLPGMFGVHFDTSKMIIFSLMGYLLMLAVFAVGFTYGRLEHTPSS